MDFLQTLEPNGVLLAVGLGCVCCLVLIILAFGIQIIGTVIGFLTHIIELVFGILGAGPIPGCGCVLVFGGCGTLLVIGYLLVSAVNGCDINPTNFCTLIGR